MRDWPFDPALRDFGATYTPAIVQPGDEYWRVIQAVGPVDIGSNHHLYVDVLDYAALRIMGVNVEFYWNDGHDIRPTEAKPGEPAALSFPLYAGGNAYGVRVADGKPSDEIFGMGLGNFVPHHSFRVVFQLARAQAGTPWVPAPPPVTPLQEALRNMQHWLDIAKGLA